MSKIKSLEWLKAKRAEWGDKIVATTNGAFDLLHKGHIYIFEAAKKNSDILIVGVNSDQSIKQYKSPTRPINGIDDRLAVLEAIGCIDYLVVFEEADPREFLRAINPDAHFKSKEGYKGIEEEVLDRSKIKLLEDIPNYSSSLLFKKLYHDMIYWDMQRGTPRTEADPLD